MAEIVYHSSAKTQALTPEEVRQLSTLYSARGVATKQRGEMYLDLAGQAMSVDDNRYKALENTRHLVAALTDVQATGAQVDSAKVAALGKLFANEQEILARSIEERDQVDETVQRRVEEAVNNLPPVSREDPATLQETVWGAAMLAGLSPSDVGTVKYLFKEYGFDVREDLSWITADIQEAAQRLVVASQRQEAVLNETIATVQQMTLGYERLLSTTTEDAYNAEIDELVDMATDMASELFEGTVGELDIDMTPLDQFDRQISEFDNQIDAIQPSESSDPFVRIANDVLNEPEFQQWAQAQGFDLNNPLDQDLAIFRAGRLAGNPELERRMGNRDARAEYNMVTVTLPGPGFGDPSAEGPGAGLQKIDGEWAPSDLEKYDLNRDGDLAPTELAEAAQFQTGGPVEAVATLPDGSKVYRSGLGQPVQYTGLVVPPRYGDPPDLVRVLLNDGTERKFYRDTVDIAEVPKPKQDMVLGPHFYGRGIEEAGPGARLAADPMDLETGGRQEARRAARREPEALAELDAPEGLIERQQRKSQERMARRQAMASRDRGPSPEPMRDRLQALRTTPEEAALPPPPEPPPEPPWPGEDIEPWEEPFERATSTRPVNVPQLPQLPKVIGEGEYSTDLEGPVGGVKEPYRRREGGQQVGSARLPRVARAKQRVILAGGGPKPDVPFEGDLVGSDTTDEDPGGEQRRSRFRSRQLRIKHGLGNPDASEESISPDEMKGKRRRRRRRDVLSTALDSSQTR